MVELLERIKHDFSKNNVRYSSHSAVRLYESDIHKELLQQMVLNAEIVEMYPDAYPCPSLLVLMFESTSPFHAVLAKCKDVTPR